MYSATKNFLQNESGATAIEYGLIAALISVAAVTALSSVGVSLTGMFEQVSDDVDNAVTTPESEG